MIKRTRCFFCGKDTLYQVKDSKTKNFTGYSWRCDCMPEGLVLTVGQKND